MESIAIVQRGKAFAQESISLPSLKEHQVYVKVEYGAFNPIDRKGGL
jgi:NADPH:quinone reductase-like Zn-dependent oxidoreductase